MKKSYLFSLLNLLLFLSLLFISRPGFALSSDWQGIEETQVRLISAQTALGDSKQVTLGLHFKMKEGWKVYWRSPGDAGYPPEVNWEGSKNVQSAEMRWPRPERFMVLGLETVGYKKEVVYPLNLTLENPNQNTSLQAQVRFLTCSDICVPVEKTLTLDLPAGPASASDEAHLINRFNSQVPLAAEELGVVLEQASIHLDQDQAKGGMLRLRVRTPWALASPDVLVEGPVELAFFNPSAQRSSDHKVAIVDVPFDGLQFLEQDVATKDLRVTFMDGSRSVEMVTRASTMVGPLPKVDGFSNFVTSSQDTLSLGIVLALAVLGGLILNLMPCVLPVLSLKVLGLVGHGGAEKTTVRLSFLASSAGIIFSFLVMAGALIFLKNTGAAIGWGIQFQQPLFLIALSAILVLFACNMWGWFEVGLPGWLSDMGEKSSHVHGLGGHFLTGAFATLLATPCSAPFLGTAVGFALSQGPLEIIMVFSALGVGLALPYLLIALFPAFATKLPKPGAWMVTLRKVLGGALLLTAIWLLTVLSAQIGTTGGLVLAALMALVIVLFMLREKLNGPATILIVGAFVAAFFVPAAFQQNTVAKSEAEKMWVTFDRPAISELVAQGKVVFVDVTADWCLTCQVNKNFVLYQGAVYEELTDKGLTAMKADWTNPDPIISDYLATYKKFAIPFNMVYGPGAPEGIVLPELLTEDSVLAALDKAKG
jgi:suppressor for copper-sensitivity B